MKTRGALFTTQMAQALANTKPGVWPPQPIDPSKPAKWQTRRPLRSQPSTRWPVQSNDNLPVRMGPLGSIGNYGSIPAGSVATFRSFENMTKPSASQSIYMWCREDCPLGRPGDRVYVRETWRIPEVHDKTRPSILPDDCPVWYQAAEPPPSDMPWSSKWKPSIHMPKKLSRIWAKVVGVKAQRLQDITAVDVVAEGFLTESELARYGADGAISAFSAAWNGIYGPGSWSANPWVWVVDLARKEHL